MLKPDTFSMNLLIQGELGLPSNKVGPGNSETKGPQNECPSQTQVIYSLLYFGSIYWASTVLVKLISLPNYNRGTGYI